MLGAIFPVKAIAKNSEPSRSTREIAADEKDTPPCVRIINAEHSNVRRVSLNVYPVADIRCSGGLHRNKLAVLIFHFQLVNIQISGIGQWRQERPASRPPCSTNYPNPHDRRGTGAAGSSYSTSHWDKFLFAGYAPGPHTAATVKSGQ